jgi:hypothetical protein
LIDIRFIKSQKSVTMNLDVISHNFQMFKSTRS